MSLLETKVLPKLEGEYKTKIKTYKEVENENGGYVETTLILPDREFKYLIFPSQVNYVASCLRNQFEITEEVTLADVLAKATKKEFTVYITWNNEFGRYNIALHQPQVSEDETF